MATLMDSTGAGGGREQAARRMQLSVLVVAALVAALVGFAGSGTGAAQVSTGEQGVFSGTVTAPAGVSIADVVVSAGYWCPGYQDCPDPGLADDHQRPQPIANGDGWVWVSETSPDSSGNWSLTVDGTEYPTFVVWDRSGDLATNLRYSWDGLDFELEPGGRAEGRFTAQDAGLLSADIYAIASPNGLFSLDVDPDTGGFTTPALAPGEWKLGWLFPPNGDLLPNTSAASVDVAAGQTANAGTIEVNPATHGAIKGTVTDNNGQALEGIQVTGRYPEDPYEGNQNWNIYGYGTPSDYGDFEFTAVTDANGNYTTHTNLMPGNWQMEFLIPAPKVQFTAIAAGGRHSCALATDRTIACWGNNDWNGQTDAPPGAHTAIATGFKHSCALATSGTITCWGYNRDGQTDAPAGAHTAIATGFEHSCALATSGTITCWGNNDSGQTDAPPGAHTAIATGGNHSCALATGGTITCWGANWGGQTDAPPGAHTAIATGFDHSCALATDQTITCWGNNRDGQTDAPPGTHTAIATGGNHSCALATGGTIACWGNNDSGQTDAPAGAHTAIAAGDRHSCALATDQTITCWGDNRDGQLFPTVKVVLEGVVVPSGGTVVCDTAWNPAAPGGVEASCSDRGPDEAAPEDGSGAAERCFGSHQFGAEPVDVAKSADGLAVLARLSWGFHDAIGCYLALDPAALEVLRASPAPQGFPAGDAEAARRCFESHQFGAQPVDVAKSADGQTVLAQVSWGYHDAIGCYLALDRAATTVLRAAHT